MANALEEEIAGGSGSGEEEEQTKDIFRIIALILSLRSCLTFRSRALHNNSPQRINSWEGSFTNKNMSMVKS